MAHEKFRMVGAHVSESGAADAGAFGIAKVTYDSDRVRYSVAYDRTFGTRPAAVVTPVGPGRRHARYNLYTGDKPKIAAEVDTYAQSAGERIKATPSAFDLLVVRSGHGERPLYDRSGDVALIARGGTVAAAGGLSRNHGLKAARVESGHRYTVEFEGFADTPVLAVTVHGSDATTRAVVVRTRSVDAAEVVVLDETGQPRACAFDIVAVGPPAAGSGGKARIISGIVHRNGKKILAGDGFTVIEGDEARYDIAFDAAFSSPPLIVATAEHQAEGHLRQLQIASVSAETCKLEIYGRTVKSGGGVADEGKKGNSYNDSHFHFIALLPT